MKASKKILIAVLVALAVLLAVPTGAETTTTAETETTETTDTWVLYCAEYGVNPDAPTDSQVNYYLDAWCGSVEEEQVLNNL